MTAIADLAVSEVPERLGRVGWDAARIAAAALLSDGAELVRRDDVDVVVDATGAPIAGVRHALAAIAAG